MKNPFKKKDLKKMGIDLKLMKAERRTKYDEEYSKYFLEFPDEVVPFKGWQPYIFNDYEILPFEYLSTKQAKNHFEFFISSFDDNINKLKEIYEMYGYDKNDLDYSETSLIKLQEFIDKHVDIINIPDNEIEIEKEIKTKVFKSQNKFKGITNRSIKSFHQHNLDSISTEEISLFWCCILYYIGIYVSRMIVMNSDAKWKICKDNKSAEFNKPVLYYKSVYRSIVTFPKVIVSQKYLLKNRPQANLLDAYKSNIKRLS